MSSLHTSDDIALAVGRAVLWAGLIILAVAATSFVAWWFRHWIKRTLQRVIKKIIETAIVVMDVVKKRQRKLASGLKMAAKGLGDRIKNQGTEGAAKEKAEPEAEFIIDNGT